MTDEFTKERIAELRRWTMSRGSVPGMGIAKHVPGLLDAIERRDARIAELEGVPATEIETRDPDKLLAIIRGMDVECVGAMNEAKRAREERDAALARVGELTEALATARDDTLEEAAQICAQNSDEVGRFVAAKGRVGDFFAMVLRQKVRGATGGATSQVSSDVSRSSRNDRNDPE